MKKLVTAIALSAVMATPAFAGKALGTVKLVYTQGDLIFASINGYGTSGVPSPVCATTNEFALDSTTTDGKNLYAMLLTARALGAIVAITGKGTCDLKADREDVAYGALTAN